MSAQRQDAIKRIAAPDITARKGKEPIVCLTASPDDILRRVGEGSSRPLLAGAKDRLEKIRTLLDERATIYSAATYTVDTTGLTVEQVVERVRDLVENG